MTMDDGRLKDRVYGNLYWKVKDDVVQVRYVDAHRVIPIEQNVRGSLLWNR